MSQRCFKKKRFLRLRARAKCVFSSTQEEGGDDADDGGLAVSGMGGAGPGGLSSGLAGLGISGLGGGGLERHAFAAASAWARHAVLSAQEAAREARAAAAAAAANGHGSSCGRLLALLGAPLGRCSADQFGVFRVKRSPRAHHAHEDAVAAEAAEAAGSAAAFHRDAWANAGDMAGGSPAAASAAAASAAAASAHGGLPEGHPHHPHAWSPHGGGFSAGGFDDAVATAFAVAASLRPSAVLWHEPAHAAAASLGGGLGRWAGHHTEPILEAAALVARHFGLAAGRAPRSKAAAQGHRVQWQRREEEEEEEEEGEEEEEEEEEKEDEEDDDDEGGGRGAWCRGRLRGALGEFDDRLLGTRAGLQVSFLDHPAD